MKDIRKFIAYLMGILQLDKRAFFSVLKYDILSRINNYSQCILWHSKKRPEVVPEIIP